MCFLSRQFGILPPKVVPVARTKQTVPRKEWKELKKQQLQAEGKGFHTVATGLAPFEPFSGVIGAFSHLAISPATVSPATVTPLADGSAPLSSEARVTTAPQFSPLSALLEWPKRWSGWATGGGRGALDNAPPPISASSEVSSAAALGEAVASRGGSKCREGCDVMEKKSLLRAELDSHLSLLGPAACERLGFQPREEAR